MSKTIGIDLGTTNSCMAILVDKEAMVIPNAEGERTTPSVVALTQHGEWLIGKAAKHQQLSNPCNTIFSIKRFIGRLWNEVSDEIAQVPYRIEQGDEQEVCIVLGNRRYTPQQISAMILQKLKADAETYLGETVTDAVITVPAYFNNAQREATKQAGQIAGFNVLRIINEPTAASLAYGLNQSLQQTILVFDLGGGTFDVSILDLDEGLFNVKATNGDNHLGGDDFDQTIVNWMLTEFKKERGVDLSADRMILARCYPAAERAKIMLSNALSTEITLPYIVATPNETTHLSMRLTREKFNELTGDLFDRTTRPIRQALADADLSPSAIDHVLLVGGMTRIPAISDRLGQLIGRKIHQCVDPDEVVASGAAIQAGILRGEISGKLLLDVTPLSLGIETKGGVFTRLIARNASIPTRRTETFTTAADNQTSVEIHVLQGESEMAAFNKTLGIFELSGIMPARRGLMKIDVSFEIDANGIIHVRAEDIVTGGEQEIRIEAETGSDPQEIGRILREAKMNAEIASRLCELAAARNLGEILADGIEKSLAAQRDKIETNDVAAIEEKIAILRRVSSGSDAVEISRHTRLLTEAAQVLIPAHY